MILFYVLEITGAVCIFIGILFIVSPKYLVKINSFSNKVVFLEKAPLTYPRVFGGFILLLSAYLIYLALSMN